MKVLNLNPTQKEIFGKLLDTLVDNLNCAGCNDYPIEVTVENLNDLTSIVTDKKYCDDEEYQESLVQELVIGDTIYLLDNMLAGYFSDMVNE